MGGEANIQLPSDGLGMGMGVEGAGFDADIMKMLGFSPNAMPVSATPGDVGSERSGASRAKLESGAHRRGKGG